VVVDEDIDPTNLKEVLWAMMTRVDPATDIEIVDGCWSTPLDPRMPPEKKNSGDHTNSRATFYAVRPFTWRGQYPKVSRFQKEALDDVVKTFGPRTAVSADRQHFYHGGKLLGIAAMLMADRQQSVKFGTKLSLLLAFPVGSSPIGSLRSMANQSQSDYGPRNRSARFPGTLVRPKGSSEKKVWTSN
jgi:3-octaprenyl-4-hydroxybenzoate carboxy-lyase C-terminal domain